MMPFSRREWLGISGGALAAGLYAGTASAADSGAKDPFGFCFNTSTIRQQKIGLAAEVELVAKAGYTGIEPWVREIEDYRKSGGNLKDLRKRIADAGLVVESAIGFARWIVNDEEERKQGLEQAKRDMELVAAIGGKRIAAPPTGATNEPGLVLFRAAERYRALLELGDQTGVVPQLEVWGFSRNLSRLGESTLVAMESGHPKACLLPDVYHLYKGGSDFRGLKLLSGSAFHVLHVNDYPADPPRETISDRDRLYPGDGIAPLNDILQTIHANGFRGSLSLELFNPDYWKQDPAVVVETGLRKMKDAVARALG